MGAPAAGNLLHWRHSVLKPLLGVPYVIVELQRHPEARTIAQSLAEAQSHVDVKPFLLLDNRLQKLGFDAESICEPGLIRLDIRQDVLSDVLAWMDRRQPPAWISCHGSLPNLHCKDLCRAT